MLSSISGFPELLPQDQIVFTSLLDKIRQQFELYGFSPFDSSPIEKTSVLLSKGNDTEIYGIHKLSDSQSKKELGLRFDLTVPLARYIGQRHGQLIFPYRRYQIAQVWRGERPQAGRYRQFYQCDVDIVTDGDLSIFHDAEMLLLIYKIFHTLEVDRISIKVNNCKILQGFIRIIGCQDDKISNIMRIIDKIDKISFDQISALLEQEGMNIEQIESITKFIQKRDNASALQMLEDKEKEYCNIHLNINDMNLFLNGLNELKELMNLAYSLGIPKEVINIDLSLARGLNYYSGTLYEVKLIDYPDFGSVCGGGRYENLVTNFANRKLPGIGMSIGITRLFSKILEMQKFKETKQTTAQILITNQNSKLFTYYMSIANKIRSYNFKTEVYLEEKSLAQQMKYASKKGFKVVLIANEEEMNENSIIIRNLESGKQEKIQIDSIINSLNDYLK